MRTLLRFGLFTMNACLMGCAIVPLAQDASVNRVQMGVGFEIFDAPCNEIKSVSLPTRLQELGIQSEWTDKSLGKLTVGPFIEEADSASTYSKVRQTYYFDITCGDELTTSISGDAIFEGLNTTGQWIGITDTATIEHYSMQFLQKLDL